MSVSGQHCARVYPSVAGGFVRISVRALACAWEGTAGVGEFRAWLACWEIQARRQGRPATSLRTSELARLLGVTPRTARSIATRLQRDGWLDPSGVLVLRTNDPAVGHRFTDSIGKGQGSLIIPRRVLRYLAAGASRATIATVLGILLRCLSRHRNGFESRGRIKASWIALAFGLDLRRIKAARTELERLDWIQAEPGLQRIENRHGRAYRINLAWTPPGAGMTPPQPESGRVIATPSLNQDLLPGRNENQELARTSRASGIELERAKRIPGPSLNDIKPDDLRDIGRTLELYRQAVERGLLAQSEANRLRFVALAIHAQNIGKANPPGLFAALLRRKAWAFITGVEETRASVRLKQHLYGLPVETSAPPRPLLVTKLAESSQSTTRREVVEPSRQEARPISRHLAGILSRISAANQT